MCLYTYAARVYLPWMLDTECTYTDTHVHVSHMGLLSAISLRTETLIPFSLAGSWPLPNHHPIVCAYLRKRMCVRVHIIYRGLVWDCWVEIWQIKAACACLWFILIQLYLYIVCVVSQEPRVWPLNKKQWQKKNLAFNRKTCWAAQGHKGHIVRRSCW